MHSKDDLTALTALVLEKIGKNREDFTMVLDKGARMLQYPTFPGITFGRLCVRVLHDECPTAAVMKYLNRLRATRIDLVCLFQYTSLCDRLALLDLHEGTELVITLKGLAGLPPYWFFQPQEREIPNVECHHDISWRCRLHFQQWYRKLDSSWKIEPQGEYYEHKTSAASSKSKSTFTSVDALETRIESKLL